MRRWLLCLCALTLVCVMTGAARADDLDAEIGRMDAEALFALKARIDDRLRELGEYPFVKLSEGSRGDEVLALQTRLRALGYFTREPDGRYQQTTINAMKAFEKAAGLRRDGVASVEDQQRLFALDAPAQPTPTPSPTPRPTRTPDRAKDYAVFDYRLAGLMPEKYAGSRYRVSGTLLARVDADGWLLQIDSSGSLVVLREMSLPREEGASIRVWGEYLGLTSYESESGPVTLPLLKCEYLD